MLTVGVQLATTHALAAQDCFAPRVICPRVVTADSAKLGPSGLAWDPDLGYAVSVHDDRADQKGYEIFAFKPITSTGDIMVFATPLLDSLTSDTWKLDDLEGITRTEDGWFMSSVHYP